MIQLNAASLKIALASMHEKYGNTSIVRGSALLPHVEVVSTGFDSLDSVLDNGGIPLSGITLLTGRATSGKRTLGYKILANAQRSESGRKQAVTIFDLNSTINADYLSRCGIDMEWLTCIRPRSAKESIDALIDVARSREVRVVLLDDLNQLSKEHGAERYFESSLSQLKQFLRNSALIVLAESSANLSTVEKNVLQNVIPMVSHQIEMEHTRWIVEDGGLRGYQVRARVLRNQRGRVGQSALLEIELLTTLKRETL